MKSHPLCSEGVSTSSDLVSFSIKLHFVRWNLEAQLNKLSLMRAEPLKGLRRTKVRC